MFEGTSGGVGGGAGFGLLNGFKVFENGALS